MGSKLLDENKQPLSENQHFKSFQTSPVSPNTEMGQEDVADLTSPTGKKELDRQTKEEKARILEGRELIKKQEKILKDMQIKINHLHKQLKHPELIESRKNSKELQIPIKTLGAGSRKKEEKMKKHAQDERHMLWRKREFEWPGSKSCQEREKVYNCPSSPTQKTTMVKRTQKSSHQKNICCFSLGKSVKYLLCYACLYLTLVLIYKHLPDAIWAYHLDTPGSIYHQPWTH
ncbi:uncharacterized protein LOC135299440 isoform X2 [Passer domesticus]|uniref:uncharacterized protein LOC135299440 isoform X2 n=1 Tax=Passer domesticus TaxID=48849 RepID=UPI0030FF3855